ncbi:MAG: sigma 54-interacting transcriptional regulator [Planctomycetaceae bacterium]|nr:sigma 54-interacting transcriptional regulator [Planctomycetaceae bacterium]
MQPYPHVPDTHREPTAPQSPVAPSPTATGATAGYQAHQTAHPVQPVAGSISPAHERPQHSQHPAAGTVNGPAYTVPFPPTPAAATPPAPASQAHVPAAPAGHRPVSPAPVATGYGTPAAGPTESSPVPTSQPGTVSAEETAPLSREEQLEQENTRLKRQLRSGTLQQIVGVSPAILKLRDEVAAAADHSECVLISGPEGSGKSLAARVLHAASRRGYRSLVRVDCRVHSTETLRQTLFGNGPQSAASSMPSASSFPRLHLPQESTEPTPGLLETCAGGTLVLDHIDSLSLPSQDDICQALHTAREQQHHSPAATTRVIATTQETVQQLKESGRMRPELLNLFSTTVISTPPLCSRPDDIGLLTEHFLNEAAIEQGVPTRSLTVDALNLLRQYNWPGNARELQLVIRNATTVDDGTVLTSDLLHSWISTSTEEESSADVVPGLTLREMERRLIETTFARCGGNRERTARTLKIGLRTLSGKLREYGYPPRGGPGSNRVSRRRAA